MKKYDSNIEIQLLSEPYRVRIKSGHKFMLDNVFLKQSKKVMDINSNYGLGNGTLLACKVNVNYGIITNRISKSYTDKYVMLFSYKECFFVVDINSRVLQQHFLILHDTAFGNWEFTIEQLQISYPKMKILNKL